MKLFLQISLLLLFGIVTPLFSCAEETLDPDFGDNGQLTTDFSIYDDKAFAVIVQPDQKILVAGQSENGADTDIAIARYLPNGTLDKDFNLSGQVTVAVGSGNDSAHALAIQEDGKILVAGTTDNENDLDVTVIRLHPDGILDMEFSNDGLATITLPESDDHAQSVLLQQDGKIIVAGSSKSNNSRQIFLARLNSDGVLDNSFGQDGFADISDTNDSSALNAVLQTDGRILLAGFITTEDLQRAALFAFTENGEVDISFGKEGISLSGTEEANSLFYDLEILSDGKILAAGTTVKDNYHSILLAKFTDTGNADTAFSGNGLVQADPGIETIAYGLAVAQDNTIYLTGSGSKNQDTDFILLHFSANGSLMDSDVDTEIEEEEEEEETDITINPLELLDSMQSKQAYTLTDFTSYNDVARSIVILDDGSILLVGSANNGKDSDFALLRYTPEKQAEIHQSGGVTTSEGYYIVTKPIYNITRNSATTGGYLNENSSSATVTKRGVCYGITPGSGYKDSDEVEYRKETNPETSDEEDETETTTVSNPFKSNLVLEGCTTDGNGDGDFFSNLTNITPDTTYYVRAYAILEENTSDEDTSDEDTSDENTSDEDNSDEDTSDGDTSEVEAAPETVIYGNELQFKTKDACFIATAAHGSIDKSQVTILRQFRNTYLKPSTVGQSLIRTYYRFSPPIAELISEHPGLQFITRTLLAPVTTISYLALHPQLALQLFGFTLLIIILLQKYLSPMPQKKHCTLSTLKNSRGFTLIELLVVLVIIGILAGYVGPRIMGHPEDAKRTMAAAQISGLETALESYRLDNGAYPSTEQGLQALVEAPSTGKLPPKWRKGGYMKKSKVPKDPWGNEYIYLSPGSHSDFDLISYGADNESGGEDADADVANWEIE